ncbi:nuclear transport factor 2 family protein [Frigoribacterium sp. CFBP9039]|uniref:nuclear transport factor 2 family protein n=1 Tax=Frigoribacterium sp. CFBP9029 TaxID=3096541 RepID=UPI002A6AA1FE|nr:nuclear transport factor 2 family protein [Frigoribacterium sp. CFBP9039]MDY0947138.1 nuclear transport factor 2 family protein [Frigoribacterium sp. CFBP9039]
MTTRDDHGRSIDQAQDALHQAMRGGDVSHLRELLYERLTFELPGGSVIGRAADLDAHASGATRFDKLSELHRSTLEQNGHGRTSSLVDIVVFDKSHRIEARMMYRRFWSIIEGRWQVVAGSAEPSA